MLLFLILDQFEIIRTEWRKQDRMFVPTRAREQVLKMIHESTFLVITGPAGCGKTFIARNVSLVLQRKGFHIVPIIDPKDIQSLSCDENPTVFVVDDL